MSYSLLGYKRDEEGFTVVEFLISVVVSLIVLAAISVTFMVQNKSFLAQEQVVDAQENARAALQLMIKELLMAGYDPTGITEAGIVSADLESVRFTMDLNGDGDVSDSGEDITYALDVSEDQVTRKSGSGSPQPLAENIEALSFTYFDTDDDEITNTPLSAANLLEVRRIGVDITAKTANSISLNFDRGTENKYIIIANTGQVWQLLADTITPCAFAGSGQRRLKSSATPPNLRKTEAGYDPTGDDTWGFDSSS